MLISVDGHSSFFIVQKTKCEHQITQLDAIFAAGKFIGTDDDETKVLKVAFVRER